MIFGFIPLLDIAAKPPHWEHDEYLALKNMQELQPFRGLAGGWVKPRVRVKMGRHDMADDAIDDGYQTLSYTTRIKGPGILSDRQLGRPVIVPVVDEREDQIVLSTPKPIRPWWCD